MTDRELLVMAAKAAGIEFAHMDGHGAILFSEDPRYWNPLTDDGDALRLAVKLHIWVDTGSAEPDASSFACAMPDVEVFEPHGTDSYAATRRAIVRAAAEIGREMK